MKVNKANILSLTNNGFDFFKFVIPELIRNGNKCKNVKNPFYEDTNASVSIFFKSGKWFFKDHGDETYSGDLFTFAAFHYNLNIKTSFNEILKNINNDLNLNLTMSKSYNQVEKQLFHIRQSNKKEAIEYMKKRGITKSEHFLQSNAYGKYPASVVFLNQYQSGFERRNIGTEQELKEKRISKTQFFGEKTNTLYISTFLRAENEIFICEGAINALSFAEIDKSAIATFGATNLPSANLLSKYTSGNTVYLSGDGDKAGTKFNNKLLFLIKENNIPVKEIRIINFPSGKDANDLLLSGELTEYEKISEEAVLSEIETASGDDDINEDKTFDTPFFPENIYNELPELLKECTKLFQDKLEKDVFLIGAIGVLSACLPNIEGTYFETQYSPHLYIFVTAPPSSGKGVLKWAKYLGQIIHDKLIENSKLQASKYEIDLNEYNSMNKNEKAEFEKPAEPPFQMFFIPANSSSAGFTDVLADNGFHGIMFETEADTMAQTLKQDWGSYSDILRKAFHHEDISQKRKDTFIEIKNPHLAVVLSGTPKQVHNLMPDEENGLFSRFLYYAFEDNGGFKNPFKSQNKIDFKEYFIKKSNAIYDLFTQLNSFNKPVRFEFTEKQGNDLTSTFNKMINRNRLLVGKNFEANVKRLGLITFRIAMVLSGLRILETADITDPIICNDADYNTAIQIATTLEKHAIEVFQKLPKHKLKGIKQQFYEALPDEFNRQAYLKTAAGLSIKDKTAEKYISQFREKELLKHEYNKYRKVKT